MDPRRASLALCIAATACAAAAPSPHSVEDCDERTSRAFRESLKDDTIFVRTWHRYRRPTLCRDGEAAASCEARARAKLRRDGSPERVAYSCTNEPGGYCLVVLHNGEISTLHGKGVSWDAIGDGLWGRWGGAEVDVILASMGDERRANAFAPTEDARLRTMIFLRRSSRDEVRAELKAAGPAFSALKLGVRSGDDSSRWFVVTASCRPKDEPHPSTHEGPWYCFAGPSEKSELNADECFTTEVKCEGAREDLVEELKLRGLSHSEIGRCSASARVSCYEVSSEYSNVAGWQSYRSYFCYPSRERCQRLRPASPLWHASVESTCFEAGR